MVYKLKGGPREREVKFRIKSARYAKKQAMALGAKLVKISQQADRYMKHPCRKTNLAREAFRLRREGTVHQLTYKGPVLRSVVKDRPEKGCTVGDPKSMEEILTRLGFKKLVDVCKVRSAFRLKDYEICIDAVRNLGSFVEVEYIGKGRFTRKIGLDMIETARSLGAVGPQILKSYPELLLKEYKEGLLKAGRSLMSREVR